MFNDVSINVLHSALDGLAQRQQAISNDLANVNTPYYRARTVNFEESLSQAVAEGDNPMQTVTPSVTYSDSAGGLNGNNVDVNAETIAGARTEESYELLIRAATDRFNLLNTAIKGA
jgi:flagellar basal-body rod protein FlgB